MDRIKFLAHLRSSHADDAEAKQAMINNFLGLGNYQMDHFLNGSDSDDSEKNDDSVENYFKGRAGSSAKD